MVIAVAKLLLTLILQRKQVRQVATNVFACCSRNEKTCRFDWIVFNVKSSVVKVKFHNAVECLPSHIIQSNLIVSSPISHMVLPAKNINPTRPTADGTYHLYNYHHTRMMAETALVSSDRRVEESCILCWDHPAAIDRALSNNPVWPLIKSMVLDTSTQKKEESMTLHTWF